MRLFMGSTLIKQLSCTVCRCNSLALPLWSKLIRIVTGACTTISILPFFPFYAPLSTAQRPRSVKVRTERPYPNRECWMGFHLARTALDYFQPCSFRAPPFRQLVLLDAQLARSVPLGVRHAKRSSLPWCPPRWSVRRLQCPGCDGGKN